MDFCKTYESHFIGTGMNSTGHARHYLSGLLGTQRRKNIETIHNDVSSSDYQGMEQFISSSPWEHEPLMAQVGREASTMMSGPKNTGLFIDETSFLKKGKSSAGVQRQWSGRAGKIDNCQVAVFACLGDGKRMALTDFRLFLPESWAEDKERCDKAKIPQEQQRYLAKWELALEMVRQARQNGQEFGWVGADSLYGNNAKFLNAIEDMGENFVGDLHSTTKVWTSQPLLESPEEENTIPKGRPRKYPRLDGDNAAQYLSVREISEEEFEEKSQKISYRKGTKGSLTTRFMMREVWCWEKGWSHARKRLLLISRDADDNFKWTLTNLTDSEDVKRHAWRQGQRFWIEHAFHEAKSQLGMAQYQVRVWRGWHHHMALVCLAQLFSEKTRNTNQESHPLLSARDITELLDYYLPRKKRSESEVLAQITERHRLRQLDLARRRNHTTGLPEI